MNPSKGLSAPDKAWQELQASWWISGCFNVESGIGAVQTRYFTHCECYLSPLENLECDLCGRSDATSLALPTGHGDGLYPVFVLEDSHGGATGAIAFFTAEWSAAVEDKSWAPAEILQNATPIRVGTLHSTGRLHFSEISTGLNDSNVTVDVTVPPGEYELVAWIAEVPSLREAHIESPHRPIAVGAYGSALIEALNAVATVDRNQSSWHPFQPWNTMSWQVMSNIFPEWPRALIYNFGDDIRRGDDARAMSWMLQGAIHGDEESLQRAGDLLESHDAEVVEYRNQLLSWRGHMSTTD